MTVYLFPYLVKLTLYWVALVLSFIFDFKLPAAGPQSEQVAWDLKGFLHVLFAVGGCMLLGSLFKIWQLTRGGGALVASELGGREISTTSEDMRERQLLNIVHEMALAAGIATPRAYVLDHEAGINAFAAGTDPSSAVVAVTRGALEHLSRDELQAVVAHEFSHILNGDMRLNIQLIGMLYGVMALSMIGHILLRTSGSFLSTGNIKQMNDGAGALFGLFGLFIWMLGSFTGLTLIACGWSGHLAGKIAKAALSREREYLADASAVQFTRNPDGLASALERIAQMGSRLHHPRAEMASHMLIGAGFDHRALFASHPPIERRIARLRPAAPALED